LLPELEVYAVETHADEASVRGEGDSAVTVVPRVALVLAEDWKLGRVDGAQLVRW